MLLLPRMVSRLWAERWDVVCVVHLSPVVVGHTIAFEASRRTLEGIARGFRGAGRVSVRTCVSRGFGNARCVVWFVEGDDIEGDPLALPVGRDMEVGIVVAKFGCRALAARLGAVAWLKVESPAAFPEAVERTLGPCLRRGASTESALELFKDAAAAFCEISL